MHYPRETFNTYSGSKIRMPCINVRVLGIGWSETWEAAVGFLSDPSVSCEYFSESDLQILKRAVEERLEQMARATPPPNGKASDGEVQKETDCD